MAKAELMFDNLGGASDTESGHFTYVYDGTSWQGQVSGLAFTPKRVIMSGASSTSINLTQFLDTVSNVVVTTLNGVTSSNAYNFAISGNSFTYNKGLSSSLNGLEIYWTAYRD